MVIRENERVRLISRGGHDYAKRYPWIVEAARANRHKHFAIDGEAVVLGVDAPRAYFEVYRRAVESNRRRLSTRRWRWFSLP